MMPGWMMARCNAIIVLCFLLTGCQVFQTPINDKSDGEIYRPPTLAVINQDSQQIQSTDSPQTAEITQMPTCTDNLVYTADLTIPDGTEVSPGAGLDKQWEVENQGTCNWNENYRLKFIGGEQLSASPEQALIPARSGTKTIIRIQMTAPQEAGNYRSAWQAYSPADEPFGDPIFIDFFVVESSTSP